MRSDAYANARKIAWALAVAARADGTVTPTWDSLVETTGLSRSTVAAWLSRLQAWGLVRVLESGSTVRTRRGRDPQLGNRAAVYVLRIPVDESRTPTVLPKVEPPIAGARLDDSPTAASGGGPAEPPWPSTAKTRTRADELRAAETLRGRVQAFRRLSPRAVRSLIRSWLRAGWTVADLVWALDHEPDGTDRWKTQAVRQPIGWAKARLAPWEGLEPPSARSEAARAAERAAHQEFLAERAAAVAAAVPMPASVREAWLAARKAS